MLPEKVKEAIKYITFHQKFWDTHRAKSNYMKRLKKKRLIEIRFLLSTVIYPQFEEMANAALPEAVSIVMSKFVDIKDVHLGDRA